MEEYDFKKGRETKNVNLSNLEEELKEVKQEMLRQRVSDNFKGDLESELNHLRDDFINDFYQLRFGDSASATIKKKIAFIFARIKGMDFDTAERLYVGLERELLNDEIKSRDSSYKEYNKLRQEYFNARVKGESINKKLSAVEELISSYKGIISDLNKVIEYKQLSKLDSEVKKPTLSSVLYEDYENKTTSDINSQLTNFTNKLYESKSYFERKKVDFLQVVGELKSIQKSVVIYRSLYNKQEERVRVISSAMVYLHDKYMNTAFEVVVNQAKRMNLNDKKLKRVVDSLVNDKEGTFARTKLQYNSLFLELMESLRVPFSQDINFSQVKTDNEDLDRELAVLNEDARSQKTKRNYVFDNKREEFIKERYEPPSV